MAGSCRPRRGIGSRTPGTTRAADAPTSGSCPRPEGTSRDASTPATGSTARGTGPRTERRFATTGGDGVVRVWDASGRLVHRRTVAAAHLSGLQYSADGHRIVVSERAGKVRWLDATRLTQIGRPMDIGGSILTFALAGRDGSRVLAVTYTPQPPKPNETYPTAQRWVLADAATGMVRRGRTELENVSAADLSPDSTRIALGGSDGTVELLDATTGDRIRTPDSGHDSAVVSVAYSPTSKYFVTGAQDGSVSLWNGRDGELLGSVHAQPRRSGVGAGPARRTDGADRQPAGTVLRVGHPTRAPGRIRLHVRWTRPHDAGVAGRVRRAEPGTGLPVRMKGPSARDVGRRRNATRIGRSFTPGPPGHSKGTNR